MRNIVSPIKQNAPTPPRIDNINFVLSLGINGTMDVVSFPGEVETSVEVEVVAGATFVVVDFVALAHRQSHFSLQGATKIVTWH